MKLKIPTSNRCIIRMEAGIYGLGRSNGAIPPKMEKQRPKMMAAQDLFRNVLPANGMATNV
jgi:hypothetical protein